MMEPCRHLKDRGLSQSEAAKPFGATQPRVSNLARGKIDRFSHDTLVDMVAATGMRVELKVTRAV